MSVGSEEAHYMLETLETLVRDLLVATRGRHFVTSLRTRTCTGRCSSLDGKKKARSTEKTNRCFSTTITPGTAGAERHPIAQVNQQREFVWKWVGALLGFF